MDTTKSAADTLAERLLKEGFKVQRYDAYSSNSVYLKLDYGVANSIRIGDHPGKANLSYRFNLMVKAKGMSSSVSNKGFTQYFYGLNDLEDLIKDIVSNKTERIKKYRGLQSYKNIMERSKKENDGADGFWKQAHELALDSKGSVVSV